MATSTNRVSSNEAGGRILNGRIEAIGVFDLLRVAVTQHGTGRLLLFNEECVAELFYEQGYLVCARSNDVRGMKVLLMVINMRQGEFEYISDQLPPDEKNDTRLHDTMMLAITEHYRELVSTRRNNSSRPPIMRPSGVHRLGTAADGGRSPATSVSRDVPGSVASSSSPAVPGFIERPLASGEAGRGIVDSTGRFSDRVGAISELDLECAAQLAELSYDVASVFGFTRLERFELRRGTRGGMLCRLARDGIRVARLENESDLGQVWLGLEP